MQSNRYYNMINNSDSPIVHLFAYDGEFGGKNFSQSFRHNAPFKLMFHAE